MIYADQWSVAVAMVNISSCGRTNKTDRHWTVRDVNIYVSITTLLDMIRREVGRWRCDRLAEKTARSGSDFLIATKLGPSLLFHLYSYWRLIICMWGTWKHVLLSHSYNSDVIKLRPKFRSSKLVDSVSLVLLLQRVELLFFCNVIFFLNFVLLFTIYTSNIIIYMHKVLTTWIIWFDF